MAAKSGSRVLINKPSYCARKPSPTDAASEPIAGKQDAQPIADVSVPSDPALSITMVIIRI